MNLLRLRTLAWICALPMANAARAQFTFNPSLTDSQVEAPKIVVGGTVAFDLISTKEGRFNIPLRFGNVMPSSETVDLDGRTLVRDVDYSIDYAAGSIYLKQAVRDGQSLRVQYRYDQSKKRAGTFGMSFAGGLSNFRFNIAGGSQFVLGLGQTERLADGTVLSSNVYGLANSFNLAPNTKMTGVFMVGEREKSNASDLLGQDSGKGSDIEEGRGTAIVQNIQTNALGGKLNLGYQDIDDRFTGMSALVGNGIDEKQAQTLANERGLKRTSFGFDNIGSKAFNLSQGYNWVGDANGGITWRSFGLDMAGIKASWQSQYVDQGFTDFNKLRESDKQQLMKEKGLSRDVFGLAAPILGGKLNYNNLTVGTDDGEGIVRQTLGVDTKSFKANFIDQRVDDGFTRFNDLREADKGQLAKERGMNRLAWDFNAKLGGLDFSGANSQFGRDGASLSSRSFGLAAKNWHFGFVNKGADTDFNDYNSLTQDDKNSAVADALKMYDPKLNPNGNDFNNMNNLSGLTRTSWNFGLTGGKTSAAEFQHIAVDSDASGLTLDKASLTSGKTSLSVSNLRSNDANMDFGKLLWTEQRLLGNVDGLNKLDLNFATQIGKGMGISANHMNADSPIGGASRTLFNLTNKDLGLTYARRSVDEGFASVGAMADDESKLLAGMIGFDQSQTSGFWQASKNLRFDFNQQTADSGVLNQTRNFSQVSAAWNLSKQTQVKVATTSTEFTDGDAKTVDQSYRQLQVKQDLGKTGKVTLTDEEQTYDGQNDTLPDAVKRSLAYETKLTKTTDFKTEHSVTNYENGNRETSQSNTVAQKLSDRVGVSVTDTKILRDGDAPDETHRDYGFWVDFGKGIKLNYQYKRDLTGPDAGTLNSQTSLSGGEVGGIKLDGATYNHSRIDDKRDTHLGNVSFANVKPFELGDFKNIKFYYHTNTQKDYYDWKKEDLGFGFSTQVGKVGLGYDYTSQIAPNDDRAIDRYFSLNTDATGKSRLRGTFKYGVRTMPDDQDVMIRDYKLTFDASKNLSIVHSLETNPAQQKNNVLLGSLPLDQRQVSWGAKYQNDKRFKFDFGWNEMKRDQLQESLRREARLDMTFLADKPSPFKLSYALQEYDKNTERTFSHTFGFSFAQRPGPNQSFSVNFERMNWVSGRPANSGLRDWQFRLDYSLRF